jgi:hypothetical protein
MKRHEGYPAIRREFACPINDALASYGCDRMSADQLGAPGEPGQRIVGLTSHAKRGAGLAEMTLSVVNTTIRDGRRLESREIVTVIVGQPAAIIVPLLLIGQDGEEPTWHAVLIRRHRLGQPGLAWTLPRGRVAASGSSPEEPPDLLASRVLNETLGSHYLASSGSGFETVDLGTTSVSGELQPARVLALRSVALKQFDRRKLNGETLFAPLRSIKMMIGKNWLTESEVVAALYKCECALQP